MRAARAEASAPPGLAARRAAVRLVAGVLDHGRMLGAADGLPPPERAEAERLADLTLRRLGQIDDILRRHVERRPPSPVCHVLRVMTAELVFGGGAAHASVDLAVRQAKAGRTARLAGLVNALGRRVAVGGPALAAGQDAAELNTPEWLARRLVADRDPEVARAIAEAHLRPAPHDLTVKVPGDAEALAAELGARRLPMGTLRLTERAQLSALPGFAAGAWWAQDAAAALPARLIPEPAGKRVLDLCAAPGGKTLQLAAAGARVTALDLSAERIARLEQNLRRTGLAARPVVADALEWAPDAPFDAILLDAPCSATGTIRRHPDLPWRTDGGGVAGLVDLQARLLERSFGWLKPGGVLVYAVCSLLGEEGEGQIERLLGREAEARLEPATGLPAELIDDRGCLRTRPDLWPDLGGMDGFFAARLIRG